MEDVKKGASGKGMGVISFLAGLVLALGLGWGVFPSLLYSKKTQPLNFPHSSHTDLLCEDCHYTREDGTYSGIPGIDNCIQCHEAPMTESEDERVLVEDYIEQGREIPWLVYAWQPDNVYFSHAAHTESQGLECVRCHRDVMKDETLPVYKENRLTGYSKSTMKMVECEKCHAERGASNACQVCHK